jgi:TetR/AcrR family transcriptional regulator
LSQPADQLKASAARRDGPSTRLRILDAALKAFARNGFDGVSLRTIAEEAGVNHQLIGHHFGSKQDLWDAALDSRVEVFKKLHSALDVAGEVSDPREQFRSFQRAVVEYTIANPENACINYHEALVNRSAKKNSDRYQRLLERQVTRYREITERLLAQAQDAGIIPEMPIDDLWFVWQGAVLHRIIVAKQSEYFSGVPIEESVDVHTEAIVRLFVR